FYTIDYYVKVRKKGSASGTYQGSDTFNVFQLDGVGGLNVSGNYRFQITGLRKIRFIGCSANINVTPTIIDFGNILLPDTTSPDQFKDKKD
ncbi:fimbrial protein, partial [Proteus mirabilis]|nr:fimbrial protein [Proteus mirabilis]